MKFIKISVLLYFILSVIIQQYFISPAKAFEPKPFESKVGFGEFRLGQKRCMSEKCEKISLGNLERIKKTVTIRGVKCQAEILLLSDFESHELYAVEANMHERGSAGCNLTNSMIMGAVVEKYNKTALERDWVWGRNIDGFIYFYAKDILKQYTINMIIRTADQNIMDITKFPYNLLTLQYFEDVSVMDKWNQWRRKDRVEKERKKTFRPPGDV